MFTEPYIGTITIFGGTFAPQNWAFCQGQSIPISTNEALFSLIGTTYGGDGEQTFNLPDLRGRKAIGAGAGGGGGTFPAYDLGAAGGTESITLTVSQIPAHSHSFGAASGGPLASSAIGTNSAAVENAPAVLPGGHMAYASAAGGTSLGASHTTATTPATGGNSAIDVRSPYLAMNYLICVEGIFPSRG